MKPYQMEYEELPFKIYIRKLKKKTFRLSFQINRLTNV